MLRIIGTIGDKTYEKETPIPSKVVMDRFPNLPLPTKDNPIYIEMDDRHRGKDGFGEAIAQSSISIPNTITVETTEGDSFKLTYVTGKAGRGKNRIVLDAVRTQLEYKDLDKAITLVLFRRCPQSPVAARAGFDYKVVDPSIETRRKFDLSVKVNNLAADILGNIPLLALQIKAGGLSVKGQTARSEIRQGEVALRNKLIVMLNQFPEEFIKEWNKPQNELDGMIWNALVTGIVTRGEEEGGQKILKFSPELGGRRITYVGQGSEYEQLKNATLVDSDVMVVIRRYFENASRDTKPAPAPSAEPAVIQTKEQKRYDDDMESISAAKGLNILRYDPETGSVELKDTKGDESSIAVLDFEQLQEVNGVWEEALQRVFLAEKSVRQKVQMALFHINKKLQNG